MMTDAREAVSCAIELGFLVHPKFHSCNLCKDLAQLYHHYKGYDYDNWLAVVPLCNSCHQYAHGVRSQDFNNYFISLNLSHPHPDEIKAYRYKRLHKKRKVSATQTFFGSKLDI